VNGTASSETHVIRADRPLMIGALRPTGRLVVACRLRCVFDISGAGKLLTRQFTFFTAYTAIMRSLRAIIPTALVLLSASVAQAASSAWKFDDAVVSITGKGAGANAFKDK
jgi:hypothetical protein